MRVLIDIGHPAHVHYFKFLIQKIEQNMGVVKVVAREKEVSHTLLNAYAIPFENRGKGGNGIIGKFIYLLKATRFVKKIAFNFKPDIVLSFASPYAAKASYQLGIPHLDLDDTDHANFARKFYLKYTTKVLTPKSFNIDLGPKHMRFDGFMEMCYLHPSVYHPNNNILNELQLIPNEYFVVLRFVSFQASHDIGQTGMSYAFKTELISMLEEQGFKVFISSEAEIPEQFKKYKLTIAPEKMHDLLFHAFCFIGEGATMASECAMLGTPAIYINSLDAGTLQEQEKLGLIKGFRSEKEVKDKLKNWLLVPNRKIKTRQIAADVLFKFKSPTDLIYNHLKNLSHH
ncbi:MAG: DUF354 domain-containing protein [Fluviicola sp.]